MGLNRITIFVMVRVPVGWLVTHPARREVGAREGCAEIVVVALEGRWRGGGCGELGVAAWLEDGTKIVPAGFVEVYAAWCGWVGGCADAGQRCGGMLVGGRE